VWTQTLVVDRTAPTLVGSTNRYVFGGGRLTIPVRDNVTGPTKPSVSVSVPARGASTQAFTLTDKAGNSRTVRVRVQRAMSLSNAKANRGISLRVGGRSIDAGSVNLGAIFGFVDYASPWFASRGQTHPYITELQQRLKTLGYWSFAAPISGKLDVATIRAVQRFQRANAIPAIGTAGPITRRALDAALLARK
jgi:hypothetical protein